MKSKSNKRRLASVGASLETEPTVGRVLQELVLCRVSKPVTETVRKQAEAERQRKRAEEAMKKLEEEMKNLGRTLSF